MSLCTCEAAAAPRYISLYSNPDAPARDVMPRVVARQPSLGRYLSCYDFSDRLGFFAFEEVRLKWAVAADKPGAHEAFAAFLRGRFGPASVKDMFALQAIAEEHAPEPVAAAEAAAEPEAPNAIPAVTEAKPARRRFFPRLSDIRLRFWRRSAQWTLPVTDAIYSKSPRWAGDTRTGTMWDGRSRVGACEVLVA